MIPKKDKDFRCRGNLWPISLISALPKLFETMPLKVIKKKLAVKKLIHPAQFGFHRRTGMVHQAAHLEGTIRQARDKHRKVLVAFLVGEQTYDRLWREHILYKLQETDVNRELISMLLTDPSVAS